MSPRKGKASPTTRRTRSTSWRRWRASRSGRCVTTSRRRCCRRPCDRGGIALYGQEHLQRLQLIARLRDRGLQLNAIRDALSRVEKGELWLEDWLGLSAELRTPWSEERPIHLSEEELADRLGHRPGLVAALLDAGLLRRAPHPTASYLVRSPGLLDIALELDAAGVDIDLAAEAAATLRKQLRAAAGALVTQALDRAGEGFARSGSTADVTKALGALRPLGIRAVNLIFAQEIERALRRAVDTGKAAPPTRPPQINPSADQDTNTPTASPEPGWEG